ncbi:MAG: filamentation induced by cAMP protein Fic [Chloroflexi bacterium]|nr:filamentation induced by cAMP protein Fic [Chloroflexota bacterium]
MRGTLVRRTWVWNPGVYAPARHRRSCGYDAFIPAALADLRLQLPGDVAGVVSDAEHAVADLNRRAGPELAPLARLLLRTESIASSKVEGMQVDARALARAEANQDAGRRGGPEAVEILANIDAMQLAIERASTATPIRVADIVDIHTELLAQGPTPGIAGRIRTSQSWIGGNDHNPCGADFVPPPPEEVERLLHDLALFCNEETLPPLVQAAVAHAQFETIHPFDDGNGRTGRALVQIVLRRRGLAPAFVPPVSVILARARDRYIEGLTRFREDRIAEWLETFAVATRQAADLAVRYAGRVAELQDRWRQQLRETSNPRADAAAWAMIEILPAYPVVTVPVGVAATRRTKPAVTNGVAELERSGVLRRLTESARNRAWEAEGLLDLVVRLESGLD